jgi:rod shape-determining protein MreD
MISIIKNILRFIILVSIQVFLLKNLLIYGLNIPYLYILFILLLPFQTPNWLLFSLAFVTGLSIDIFSNTLGLHASACIILAFFRTIIIRLTVQEESYESQPIPALGVMGFRWFFFYTLILTLIHHFFLLNFEVFRFTEILSTLGRVLISSSFTIILIFTSELIFFKRKQR